MDSLDLGILRELSRDQIVWFGSLDPRFSAAQIARRLRVDRATVSCRLHLWERQGFLTGHEIVPSPLVFGASIAGGNLRVDALRHKPRILEDLALVPGVISAVDHVGPWVALLFAFETRPGLERSRRLLAKLEGVGEVTPCVPFQAPEPNVAPTPLDWRILNALRTRPRRPLHDIAKSVPISAKTLARRMDGLVRGRVMWYLPLLDFTRYTKATVTRLVVTVRPGAILERVSEAAARVVPGLSNLVDTSPLVGSGGPMPAILDIVAHLDSVGHAEDVQRTLSTLDSVEEVEVLFPRRFYLYRGWFDEHIDLALARTQGPALPRSGGRVGVGPSRT